MFSFDGFRLAAWPKQHQNLCDGGYAYSLHHQWHAARYPRPRHDLKGCCRQTLLPISGRPRLGWQRVLGCSLRERLSEFSSYVHRVSASCAPYSCCGRNRSGCWLGARWSRSLCSARQGKGSFGKSLSIVRVIVLGSEGVWPSFVSFVVVSSVLW